MKPNKNLPTQPKRDKRVTTKINRRRLLYSMTLLTPLILSSCSTAQSISVKQSQGEQVQETIIEQKGDIKDISYYFSFGNPYQLTR